MESVAKWITLHWNNVWESPVQHKREIKRSKDGAKNCAYNIPDSPGDEEEKKKSRLCSHLTLDR